MYQYLVDIYIFQSETKDYSLIYDNVEWSHVSLSLNLVDVFDSLFIFQYYANMLISSHSPVLVTVLVRLYLLILR